MADVHLSTEQRRALCLLLNAPRGLTAVALMRVYGFTSDLLTGLVRDGLAEVVTGTARAGGRTIQVDRVRITEAGRDALAGEG
jgi:hypothetical protein